MKIFLDQPVATGDTIVVRDEFWDHYVTTVRRCREGDRLEVVGNGTVGEGPLEGTDPLTVAIEDSRSANTPSYNLTLCQAISRKQKYDDVVRRGSDMGITDFYPVVTEHTVRRPNNPEKQRDRWRRMALESARVSDRDWVSTIHPIASFEEIVERIGNGSSTIIWGDPEGENPRDVLPDTGEEVTLFVGPEGGFTDEEKQVLGNRGQAVSLGSNNYRAETSSIMLSSFWLYERLDFSIPT